MFSVSTSGPAVGLVRRIVDGLRDKAPFYAAAAELGVSQTQNRFAEQRGPDGTPWTPNAPSTLGNKQGAVILEDSGALRGGVYAAPTASMAVVNPPP
ncbi:MAG: phage virion morphogenesis protein, partial [Pseudomonadota bacterium]